jgi:hypothetical protein
MGRWLDASLAVTPTVARPSDALAAAAAGGPGDVAIVPLADELGITEVLHFTTNCGLIGVLRSGRLLSRALVPDEELVEHVYKPNTAVRYDSSWTRFVNMSITQVNEWMLSTSTNRRWNEEIFWVVLSFTPEILRQRGVVFTTTNNIYPAVKRASDAPGMAALFAPEVMGRYSSIHHRRGLADNQTTDRQAEVLYPNWVSTNYLQRIYVDSDDKQDAVAGIFGGLPTVAEVPVLCKPEVFQ